MTKVCISFMKQKGHWWINLIKPLLFFLQLDCMHRIVGYNKGHFYANKNWILDECMMLRRHWTLPMKTALFNNSNTILSFIYRHVFNQCLQLAVGWRLSQQLLFILSVTIPFRDGASHRPWGSRIRLHSQWSFTAHTLLNELWHDEHTFCPSLCHSLTLSFDSITYYPSAFCRLFVTFF